MGVLGRLVNFERPMGPVVAQILYYIGLFAVGIGAVRRIIEKSSRLADDFLGHFFGILTVLFVALLWVLVLRLVTERVRAIFRIDTSLHDILTGRSATGLANRASPDQSAD